MKKKMFQCPYENISCIHLDTSTMTLDTQCDKCEHYNNGIRLSKGLLNLRIKNWDIESFFVGFMCGIVFLALLLILFL